MTLTEGSLCEWARGGGLVFEGAAGAPPEASDSHKNCSVAESILKEGPVEGGGGCKGKGTGSDCKVWSWAGGGDPRF